MFRSIFNKTITFVIIWMIQNGTYAGIKPAKIESQAPAIAGQNDRLAAYLKKGFSEEFYNKWIDPIWFHIKWQVGFTGSVYDSTLRKQIEQFESETNPTRIVIDLDLAGIYIRYKESLNFYGAVIGANSDNSKTGPNELQIDHYSLKLSYLRFIHRLKEGWYYRLDTGLANYKKSYRKSTGLIDRDETLGFTGKTGLGYAFPFKKSSLTLEGNYSLYRYGRRNNHFISAGIGFIL